MLKRRQTPDYAEVLDLLPAPKAPEPEKVYTPEELVARAKPMLVLVVEFNDGVPPMYLEDIKSLEDELCGGYLYDFLDCAYTDSLLGGKIDPSEKKFTVSFAVITRGEFDDLPELDDVLP